MAKILGIIPSRYGSQRLKGKALIDIGGKTMVQRVFEQASKSKKLDKVIVATDDERILAHVKDFGGEAVMTSEHHPTGTDRCAEVALKFQDDYDVSINIQGDEPFINPDQIDELAKLFDDPNTQIGTLVSRIKDYDELFDYKEAKVVFNSKTMEAMYISRSPIPYYKDKIKPQWLQLHPYYKNLGIYGFQTKILASISTLPMSALEIAEGLEQVRWLEHYRIKVGVSRMSTLSIDTADDLKKATQYL